MEGVLTIALVVGWLVCTVWARNTAMARGHSRYLGLILGLFLGPVGVLIVHKLSPTGGKAIYLGCGAVVTLAGLLLVGLILGAGLLASGTGGGGASPAALGFLIMGLVVLAVGIGFMYRGLTGKEAKLPEELSNPITETALEATAMGLTKGPVDVAISIAQNIPGMYRAVKGHSQTSDAVPQGSAIDEGVLKERKNRIAAGLCPKCGSRVSPTDTNCSSCKINLGFAREHLGEW